MMGSSHSRSIASTAPPKLSHRPTDPQPPTAADATVHPSPPPPHPPTHAAYKKMARGLGLVLSTAALIRRRRRRRRRDDPGPENNKSWLLADAHNPEPDAQLELDPHSSVHSSFRFSFGSQAEADGAAASPIVDAAATVLLLVNLEDDGAGPERREGWQRLQSLERSIAPVAASLARFSYREICAATHNFSKERELGRGPLSRVYKGRMGARRRAVAIKKVEGLDRESAKAFCRELLIAGSLRHPNVAPLLGFCFGAEGLFLVYKFVSGGSLDRHLHHHEKVLPWGVRLKVAAGVARAVQYLHYGTDKCVVHRDIKPSNILLSSNKTPKLCDFGLATWTHGPSLPFLCKAVKGTFGYLAPEYFQHGKLSDKTDVYALGVVLLELISGRKAIDRNRPQGDENLVVWAKPLLQQGEGAMEKLIDPRLKPGSYRWDEMSRMIRAATACVNSEELVRPNIDQVIGMLRGEEETSFTDWSVFTTSGCLSGYGSWSNDLPEKSDMKGHIALAMLGVTDADEDDLYGR